MPGVTAAAAITGGGSCAKEEEFDDEEEDSWAVKPRGTKSRAMAGECPGMGGDPGCASGTLLHREGHHSSQLYPHHAGALLYPPAAGPVNMEGRHHGIPVEVESILLPPATLECFAFD